MATPLRYATVDARTVSYTPAPLYTSQTPAPRYSVAVADPPEYRTRSPSPIPIRQRCFRCYDLRGVCTKCHRRILPRPIRPPFHQLALNRPTLHRPFDPSSLLPPSREGVQPPWERPFQGIGTPPQGIRPRRYSYSSVVEPRCQENHVTQPPRYASRHVTFSTSDIDSDDSDGSDSSAGSERSVDKSAHSEAAESDHLTSSTSELDYDDEVEDYEYEDDAGDVEEDAGYNDYGYYSDEGPRPARLK